MAKEYSFLQRQNSNSAATLETCIGELVDVTKDLRQTLPKNDRTETILYLLISVTKEMEGYLTSISSSTN